MFCKTTRGQVTIENLGQFTRFMKEEWAPLISKQEGFKGAYYATKPNGEYVAVMLWATEEQLKSWSDNPEHKKIAAPVMPLFITDLVVDIYEVQEAL
jgi:heme-degrading monooxygenase HmoA